MDCTTCSLVGLDDCPDHGIALNEDQKRLEDVYLDLLAKQCEAEERLEECGGDPALLAWLEGFNEAYTIVQLAYSLVPGHRRRIERFLAEEQAKTGEAA